MHGRSFHVKVTDELLTDNTAKPVGAADGPVYNIYIVHRKSR